VVGKAGADDRSAPPAVRARIAVDARAAWHSGPRP
jgi:hypothetical protein